MASGPPPPTTSGSEEVESTISRLSNYRNVHGVMILSRQGGLIRTEGTAFEGEPGKVYAKAVKGIVEGVRSGIAEVDEAVSLFGNPFLVTLNDRHSRMISVYYAYEQRSTN